MRLPALGDGLVRIGVAVALPDPIAGVLQQARAAAGDPLAWSIVPHITLVGPSDLDRDVLVDLDEHLTLVAAQHGPFVVRLRGTGTFRPVSEVVFVQLVQGVAECELLARDLRAGPLDQPLRFPYHPHVTLAHDVPAAALDLAFDDLAGFDATFEASEIAVFESDDEGVWRVVRSVPLGG